MGQRIASMLGVMLAASMRDTGEPVLITRPDPWGDDGWLGLGREIGRKPCRRKRYRDFQNGYPKSRATKRRRARNKMAAKSRRRNRTKTGA